MSGGSDLTTAGHSAAVDSRKGALPLQEVVDLFSEAVAIFGADCTIECTNAAFADIYAPIDAFIRIGTPWEIFLHEAEHHGLLPKQACDNLRIAEETLPDSTGHAPAIDTRNSSGQTFAIRLTATSTGGMAMTQVSTVDQQGQEDSDRQAEVLMSKVLEACPTNLTMSRIGDGQILYRTPAATELLGTSRNSQDHFAQRAERADFVTDLLPDARVDDMRIAGRRPDGSEFPASLSARLIDYRGEDVVVTNMVDLTDELAMQSELERQKNLTFQSEKMSALGELLAGVSHELNNPLSVVVGNAMMLKEEALDQHALRRVEKLSDAAERCVRIVRTFLSMAREQPLELSNLTVAELLRTSLDAYQNTTEVQQTDVRVDLDGDLPEISVDEVQLVQVIVNLMNNADQAMSEADLGDRIHISASSEPGAGLVRIRVEDNGPGVPADIHGRIFDPLFTTKSQGKGTGVGLAFCHRVLEAHGGSIELDRHYTKGARFVLRVKIAPTG